MSLRDIENFRLIDGEKIDNLPTDTTSELAGKVEEAPTDGKKYARQNSAWSEVTTGGGWAVDSVNGFTWAVILDADDISDAATTNKYTTAAEITKLAGIEALAEVNQTDAEIKTQYEANADTNAFTDAEKTKLSVVDETAEPNNISDVNALDLTDGWESTLHFHASDRARTNHTGTQTADTITNWSVNWIETLNRIIKKDNLLSTWIITGWELTVNGWDNSKFDIASGTAIVVDNHTDPLNPVITEVSFWPFVAITVTGLATQVQTNIWIDSAWALVQQQFWFTNTQNRDIISLWVLFHPSLSVIDNSAQFTETVWIDLSNTITDIADAVWTINEEWNTFGANWINLFLDKTAWVIMFPWSNWFNDKKNPNYLTTSSDTNLTWLYTWRDWSGWFNTSLNSTVIPWIYDDWTGGVSQPNGSVSNNKYSTVRFYYSWALNLTILHYWQNTYNTFAAAISSFPTEPFEVNPDLSDTLFRGWMIVKWNATDLSSDSEANFFSANKFGDVSGWASATSVSSLQNAYNNSTRPQVVTDAIKWAVQYQRGSAADTDNVFEILNWAGTTTFSVDGNWDIVANNISWTNTWDQTEVSWKSGSTDALNSATTSVDVSSATAPTNGQVLTATSWSAATWQNAWGWLSEIFSAYANVSTVIQAWTPLKIIYWTELTDTWGNYDPITWIYTVPSDWIYQFNTSIDLVSAWVWNNVTIFIYKNSSIVSATQNAFQKNFEVRQQTRQLSLLAWDEITIRLLGVVTLWNTSSWIRSNFFEWYKLN